MNRFALLIWVAAAPLAACDTMSKAVDDVRDIANHQEEHVTYPALTTVPAKPVPYNKPADRQATVTTLRGEGATNQAAAADLCDKAAHMAITPVPGQAAQPAPQPVPSPTQTPATQTGKFNSPQQCPPEQSAAQSTTTQNPTQGVAPQ